MPLIKFSALYNSTGMIKSVEDQEKECAQEWIGRIEGVRLLLDRSGQTLAEYIEELRLRLEDEAGGNSCDAKSLSEAIAMHRILLNDDQSAEAQKSVRAIWKGKKSITQIEDICGDFKRCNEIRKMILATGYSLNP